MSLNWAAQIKEKVHQACTLFEWVNLIFSFISFVGRPSNNCQASSVQPAQPSMIIASIADFASFRKKQGAFSDVQKCQSSPVHDPTHSLFPPSIPRVASHARPIYPPLYKFSSNASTREKGKDNADSAPHIFLQCVQKVQFFDQTMFGSSWLYKDCCARFLLATFVLCPRGGYR